MDEEILELQKLIDESKFTVVSTGAGISLASGLPSFRGLMKISTWQIMSQKLLKKAPERYYRAVRKHFLNPVFANGPTLTHKKLAELEEKGKIHGIVTTNLDGLHTLAGSKNVAEIQGGFGINKCLSCGKEYNDIKIWDQGKAPRCECGGLICPYPAYGYIKLSKNDIVRAREMCGKAELLILIGTQGSFRMAYWDHFCDDIKIVQINPAKTQFDKMAALNIKRKCDDVFKEIQ